MDENINDIVANAPEYREPIDAAVKRLAALPRAEYEQVRKNEAKSLDVRTSWLDNEVKAAQGKDDSGNGFELYEPEPWEEEVDGGDLLDRIVLEIRRYVVTPEHVAEAAALWCVHTHAFDLWQVTPRLAISAPTMGSGKSVLLDVLTTMVPRALEAANLSTAVAFRAIEQFRPVLMIDEVDTFLRDNEELRGVLNSGHRKGGQVLRCEGDNIELRAFKTFAPVATAGIGRLPGTLADRSIRAELQRKRPDEYVLGFRSDRIDHLRDLSRQMARWVVDNERALLTAEPAMPEGIHNRKADNWHPLLSIADIAGGDWPMLARTAAIALSSTDADDAESLKVQMLVDIDAIFSKDTEDRMPTRKLVERLVAMEDRPWSDYRRGKPLNARQLGDMLRSFRITPSSMRFADGSNAKGYRLSSFHDVFSRYLRNCAVTTSQVNVAAGYSEFRAVTTDKFVTAQNVKNRSDSAGCDVVTARKGETAEIYDEDGILCVHCGQPIGPEHGIIPHADGAIHENCYEEWFASITHRNGCLPC
jgi:putative DNA primase/helicase